MQNIPILLGAGKSFFDSLGEFFARIDQAVEAFSPLGGYVLAIIIFIIGRMLAGICKKLVVKGLKQTTVDDKLAKFVGHDGAPEAAIGNFVYYLLLLLVAIISLGVAKLDRVTAPLMGLLDQFLGFIPHLVGAGVLLYFVLLIAKIVKNLSLSAMEAAKLDERLGAAASKAPVAGSLASALYCFIILLFIPAILGILNLNEVSEPISAIVNSILGSVDKIILASILIALGILIGQIAKRLVSSLLEAAEANSWPAKIGVDMPSEGKGSVVSIIGNTLMISIIVLLIGSAINILKIDLLAGASEIFVEGYFNVLLALIILGVGLLLSKFAYKNLQGSNPMLAKVAKYGIVILTVVVALDRSGIAPELTSLPYTLALYAAAVAGGVGGAIALGLGGREYVARKLSDK